jgi:hypothetical protein
VYTFSLDDEDLKAIEELDKGYRLSQPKYMFGVAFLGDSGRDGK